MILRAVLLASLLAAPAHARWVRVMQTTIVPDYACAWAANPRPCKPTTIRYSEWRWRL